jgi:hypothetical protein
MRFSSSRSFLASALARSVSAAAAAASRSSAAFCAAFSSLVRVRVRVRARVRVRVRVGARARATVRAHLGQLACGQLSLVSRRLYQFWGRVSVAIGECMLRRGLFRRVFVGVVE